MAAVYLCICLSFPCPRPQCVGMGLWQPEQEKSCAPCYLVWAGIHSIRPDKGIVPSRSDCLLKCIHHQRMNDIVSEGA